MHDHIHTDPADIEALIKQLNPTIDLLPLSAFVDGRGLKCPLPLLKVKIALKTMADKTYLYVIANDQNAGTDLGYFCQKQGHQITHWQDDHGNFNALIHKNGL